MNITSRLVTVAVASGALLAVTAPTHATDVLNLVNAKRIPVSALSGGNTSADNIDITDIEQAGTGTDGYEEHGELEGLVGILLHPDTVYDNQDNGF